MSLQFSNTTDKDGIIQVIEQNCGFNDGDISNDTTKLKQFTGAINLALDKVYSIIFKSGGTWQFDDSNHLNYPIITTDLVSSQRDYTFTADTSGNLILDIYKVFVKDQSGEYFEVFPVDVQSQNGTEGFSDGLNTTGIPFTYDKTANGIFLDPVPSYNATDGLKIYINREGSYFDYTDTIKKPGFAGLYHEYLALRPSYQYAYRNSLANTNVLKVEMLEMEKAIATHYGSRERDTRKRLTGSKIKFK